MCENFFRKACHWIINILAKLFNKTLCPDLEENKRRNHAELDELIKTPENFVRRIPEFHLRHLINSTASTDKNNRIMVFFTIVIFLLTVILVFLTLELSTK